MLQLLTMRCRSAFTLIELVVVILILGVLAGVAAPKLLGTSARATDHGLCQTLTIVRDAIEHYAVDHGGAIPPCTGTGADFRTALEPYIRSNFPDCPVGPAQNSDVDPRSGAQTVEGVATPTEGWTYHVDTGDFACNYAAPTASYPSMNYDDL